MVEGEVSDERFERLPARFADGTPEQQKQEPWLSWLQTGVDCWVCHCCNWEETVDGLLRPMWWDKDYNFTVCQDCYESEDGADVPLVVAAGDGEGV